MEKRVLRISIIWVIALVFAAACPVQPARAVGRNLYAAPGGATSGVCEDWAHACELSYVLSSVAVEHDGILVKAGVYKPTTSTTDRTASFIIPPGVRVLGGFAGTEIDPDERNWETNLTVLSGDLGINDANPDSNQIAESWEDIGNYNSYHVVKIIGTTTPITSTTGLDGLIITAGQATGPSPDDSGGGLYCNGEGAGHACSPQLQNLIFSGNLAYHGGAVYVNGTSGGAANPTFTNVTFTGNRAMTTWGGAIYNAGFDSGEASPWFNKVTFEGNSGYLKGGAIVNDGRSGTSNPTFLNTTFYNNSTVGDGGALYNTGGGAGNGECSPTLTNVTFSGNTANNGGAVYNDGTGTGTSAPTLTNVILWGDALAGGGAGPEMFNDEATPTISYSVVEGGCASITGAICGSGNLDTDPHLRALADNGGYAETMALGTGSSAVDTGEDLACPSTDQRGVSRPRGAACDMGAYERIPPFSDFDPDAASDPVVFERATGNWFSVGSSSGFLAPALGFGNDTSYIPVPGDYDGDTETDPAVFEKATGNWFAVGSTAGFFTPALGFGNYTNYIPVPGDYDGDGATDAAVFERATGNWFVVGSSSGFFTPALGFGNDTFYIPVASDYDGDGETDPAVFERATGNWFVVGSTWGFFTPALGFGNDTSYIPVPGDYDGDGYSDPAVFEKATGNWFVVGSNIGFFTPALGFGNDTNYRPQPGDFDGDAKMDAVVFEKATGNWFVVGSTSGFFTPALGFGNDTSYIPVVTRSQ